MAAAKRAEARVAERADRRAPPATQALACSSSASGNKHASPGIIHANSRVARANHFMSVTIAERTHASWCRTPRSNPSFVSPATRRARSRRDPRSRRERAQAAALLERPAEPRHQHVFVVVVLDLALGTE